MAGITDRKEKKKKKKALEGVEGEGGARRGGRGLVRSEGGKDARASGRQAARSGSCQDSRDRASGAIRKWRTALGRRERTRPSAPDQRVPHAAFARPRDERIATNRFTGD